MVRRPVDPVQPSPAIHAGAGRRVDRPTDHVVIAVVGAPHGLRGDVRIKSYTEDPMAIGDYGPLRGGDGKTYLVKALRPVKDDLVIARIDGVNDRTLAESLTNLELSVARTQLPAVEDEDEFYHADLIGLSVVDDSGEAIGHVVGLMNFGAGDMLDIKLKRPGPTALLPFTKAFVPAIDLAQGLIRINKPADFGQDTPPPSRGEGGRTKP